MIKSNVQNYKNMKITIINGSPRKNGATGIILKEMKNILEKKGDVEVSYFDISKNPPKQCTGCMNCYDTGVCHINDIAKEINESIKKSQGVIMGSPTYVSNVPGVLKNYIDRGHFVVEQALYNKYTFSVTTYEIAGGRSVLQMLSNLFSFSGGILSGSFILKLKVNTDPFSEKEVLEKLNRKTDNLYNAIAINRRKSLFNRLINYIALHIIIKPTVLKNRERYTATLERWRELKIIKS